MTSSRIFKDGQQLYMNPTLPFVEPIQGGLQDGHEITINGTVIFSSDDQFHVDFRSGTSGNNIPFHFNPRFREGGYVECNTRQNGSWGQAERIRPMPFQGGAPFELRFQIQSTGFKVTVNGNHFVLYPHRVPLKSVDIIMINGIVSLSCVHIQTPGFPCVPPPEQKYTLPFRTSIPGGLRPDKSMTVIGSVLPCADWFVINLRSGNDIALHLNPRFQGNAVIRNTQISGSWGLEESSLLTPMPFIRGQTFQVWIICDEQCFKVIVNGKHLFDYNHRLKTLPCINELEVAGDIHLTHVQI